MAHSLLKDELIRITLKMYDHPNVPRKTVQFLVDTLKIFSRSVLQNISREVESKLSNEYKNETIQILNDFEATLNSVMELFETEEKRFLAYHENKLLMMPRKHPLTKLEKSSSMEVLPLSWSLKQFLEIPGSYHLLIKNMDALTKDCTIVSNFIQARLWQEKSKNFGDRIVVPIHFYHDDFEAGNPLGSHAGKNSLGGLYISIPCYPPHIVTQLNNIFVHTLFLAKDRKEYGNREIYRIFIKEMNLLRTNGLKITVGTKQFTVFFEPGLCMGDNKGLNEDLGFVTTFSSGYPCRICKASVEEMKSLVQENKECLRSLENYKVDCEKKNYLKSGIMEESVFNKLIGFHVLQHVTLDLMHDVLEGTANYLMTNLTRHFIQKEHFLTLEKLNNLIAWFNNNASQLKNKIPEIKQEHISSKGHLRMSAAKMLNYTKFFGIILNQAQKKPLPSNEFYKLYLAFREIIDILLSPHMIPEFINRLKNDIPNFLSSYIKLFGDLQFKFHNMTHIVRVLENNGPLVHFWSMRMESKNKELKTTATTTSNKKDLKTTIAIKCQLKLAYMALKGSKESDTVLDQSSETDEWFKKHYFGNYQLTDVISLQQITFNGIDYKVGMVLVVNMKDVDTLDFGVVEKIFFVNKNVSILFKILSALYFDNHIYAYYVLARKSLILKTVTELPNLQPCTLIDVDSDLFVIPKHKL